MVSNTFVRAAAMQELQRFLDVAGGTVLSAFHDLTLCSHTLCSCENLVTHDNSTTILRLPCLFPLAP